MTVIKSKQEIREEEKEKKNTHEQGKKNTLLCTQKKFWEPKNFSVKTETLLVYSLKTIFYS